MCTKTKSAMSRAWLVHELKSVLCQAERRLCLYDFQLNAIYLTLISPFGPGRRDIKSLWQQLVDSAWSSRSLRRLYSISQRVVIRKARSIYFIASTPPLSRENQIKLNHTCWCLYIISKTQDGIQDPWRTSANSWWYDLKFLNEDPINHATLQQTPMGSNQLMETPKSPKRVRAPQIWIVESSVMMMTTMTTRITKELFPG